MCFLRQCCTHCLCPTLWSQCSKTGSVLAMQPLCRSHDWTVVNHYCTQNWGLTMCFLRQCCTHCLCPTLWSQCTKTGSVLAMQPLCRSHDWTVVNHYFTEKKASDRAPFAAMLDSQFVLHIVTPTPQHSGQVRSGSVSYHRPSAREMRPTARRLAEHTHTEHGESLQVQTEPRRPEGAPAGR